MKVVTAAQMRDIERRAGEAGVPSSVLMENAGLAVAREVLKYVDGVAGRNILVLAGPGNNGGDGLVAARHLHDWGARVTVALAPRPSSDPNLRLVMDRGISCLALEGDADPAGLRDIVVEAEVVIDALLGTGKPRPLAGSFKVALDSIAAARKRNAATRIVALDLPSGLNADTGEVDPVTPFADLTLTLGYAKTGLLLFPGAGRTGRMEVLDIGIPEELAANILIELLDAEFVRQALPYRAPDANKGSFGKMLMVGGSRNYIGATYLACSGGARVGAGLVTLAATQRVVAAVAAGLSEATYLTLPDDGEGNISLDASQALRSALADYKTMLIGCGLGQSDAATWFLRSLLTSLPHPAPRLVLDGDALNALSKEPGWWGGLPENTVLTPHPGEMARLTGRTVSEVQADRLGIAQRSAASWRAVVVLKGAHTIVAGPNGQVKISTSCNPGLATAGTGDVLAGVICGLLAQGLSPFTAAACGAYLHSEAGELARAALGDAGIIASDLLPYLPRVIKGLKADAHVGNALPRGGV